MKKLLLTIALILTVCTANAGIITNGGKMDYDPVYIGVDLSIIDSLFFKDLPNGESFVALITREDGLNVPEMWNWVNTNDRSAIGETPSGVPAEFVDGKIRFNTTYMFQDGVPGCQGVFHMQRQEFGIMGAIFPNNRNIEVIFNEQGERTKPQNIPCTGTSAGFVDWHGNTYLRVEVRFPADKRNEYISLVTAINAVQALSSDKDSFNNAWVTSQQPTVPAQLFFSK